MKIENKEDIDQMIEPQGYAEGEEQMTMPEEAAQAQEEAPEEEFPNRKNFAGKFSKRHSDIDFEDKEARYGALSEDADRLDQYEESGRALSDVFEKHRWMASMFEDLRDNDELDPITWMAENGIDIEQALSDDEYRKQISDKIAEFQERSVKGEEAERERESNLEKSANDLAKLGLSDDENLEIWNYLFTEVIDPALRGEISEDTGRLVQKARNYDSDIAEASSKAGMKARNEKIRNRVKDEQQRADVPPALSQGGASNARPKKEQKKESFFSDIIQ